MSKPVRWIREQIASVQTRFPAATERDIYVEWTPYGTVRLVNPVSGETFVIDIRRCLLQLADQLQVANEQVYGFEYERFQERYE